MGVLLPPRLEGAWVEAMERVQHLRQAGMLIKKNTRLKKGGNDVILFLLVLIILILLIL